MEQTAYFIRWPRWIEELRKQDIRIVLEEPTSLAGMFHVDAMRLPVVGANNLVGAAGRIRHHLPRYNVLSQILFCRQGR